MRIRGRDVADHVATAHGLTYAEFYGPCRQRHIARPRQIAMYAIKALCPHMSYPAIGRLFSNRDHTTVLHGVRKIAALMLSDPDIALQVDTVMAHFEQLRVEAVPLDDALRSAVQFHALCASYGRAMRLAA